MVDDETLEGFVPVFGEDVDEDPQPEDDLGELTDEDMDDEA